MGLLFAIIISIAEKMAIMKGLTNVIIILIFQIFISQVAFGESDEVYYVAEFNDKITECEDFVNDMMICENVEIAFVSDSEGGDGGYKLFGQLNMKKPVEDDYMIGLKIFKDTPVGREFMYSIGGNICDSLKKTDTPWYPMVEVFNTSKCPIEPGVFNLNDLVISLEFAKDALRHELCGDYIVELEFQTSAQQPLSCHNVPLEVVEKTY